MYAMSEQDLNREVPFTELLPQGDVGWESGDDELAPSQDGDAELGHLEEDEPVGPTLEDHPVLLVKGTERLLCVMCFLIVTPDRYNLCPACECRDSLINSVSRLAKRCHPCAVVNGNRIIPPNLRASINGMMATRLWARMKQKGLLPDAVPGLHQHRLVGLRTEDRFIYSDIGSTKACGLTDAAVDAFASMTAPVDDAAAASLPADREVDYDEEADYGEYASPLIKADAASAFSPAASTLGEATFGSMSPLSNIMNGVPWNQLVARCL
jgi:hypothetical protein